MMPGLFFALSDAYFWQWDRYTTVAKPLLVFRSLARRGGRKDARFDVALVALCRQFGRPWDEMLAYRTVLFDLDGTLTDPRVGITRSVQIALARFGIEVPDRDTLTPYIGPPLIGSFRQLHGLSAEDAIQAVAYYREHFATTGLYENELYPGIPELLATLHAAGATLVLATSKPTVFAERILDHFGLTCYFDLIVGSNLDHTRVDKAEVIAFALAERSVIEPARAVMVGDREHDVIGARHHGIPAIGVAYGYGTPDELRSAGAIAVANTVPELAGLLMDGKTNVGGAHGGSPR